MALGDSGGLPLTHRRTLWKPRRTTTSWACARTRATARVIHAFSRLAEHYRRESASDQSARERFQRVKQAYETLTDYDSRLRYNIERGLPDPPKTREADEDSSILGQIGVLVPENWPVLLPLLFLILGGNLGYYLLTGSLPWGGWGWTTSTSDKVIYVVGTVLFISFAALLSREQGSK